jgi:DNA-3-methyladenine glycosylase
VKLPRSFYNRPTLEVARDLIGKVLVHNRRGTITSGIIVEVEAYIGESDPACHAAPGPTTRNQPLYGPPGYAYVYLNYGMHWLVNAVTEAKESPAAVLIRALEPLEGIETMRRRRSAKGLPERTARRVAVHDLCRGPGNLTKAMGITQVQNREDLCGARLYIEDRGLPAPNEIAWGPRIGITVGTERLWRAFVLAHPSVTGPRTRVAADATARRRAR